MLFLIDGANLSLSRSITFYSGTGNAFMGYYGVCIPSIHEVAGDLGVFFQAISSGKCFDTAVAPCRIAWAHQCIYSFTYVRLCSRFSVGLIVMC